MSPRQSQAAEGTLSVFFLCVYRSFGCLDTVSTTSNIYALKICFASLFALVDFTSSLYFYLGENQGKNAGLTDSRTPAFSHQQVTRLVNIIFLCKLH